jgi:integrin beta 3
MVADKSKCGCDVVYKSDYRGTISTTKDGSECAKWTIEGIGMNNERIQEGGLDENYCRNPVNDANGPGCFPSLGTFGEDGIPIFLYCDIPACDPCSCMPECGQPNL